MSWPTVALSDCTCQSPPGAPPDATSRARHQEASCRRLGACQVSGNSLPSTHLSSQADEVWLLGSNRRSNAAVGVSVGRIGPRRRAEKEEGLRNPGREPAVELLHLGQKAVELLEPPASPPFTDLVHDWHRSRRPPWQGKGRQRSEHRG